MRIANETIEKLLKEIASLKKEKVLHMMWQHMLVSICSDRLRNNCIIIHTHGNNIRMCVYMCNGIS